MLGAARTKDSNSEKICGWVNWLLRHLLILRQWTMMSVSSPTDARVVTVDIGMNLFTLVTLVFVWNKMNVHDVVGQRLLMPRACYIHRC